MELLQRKVSVIGLGYVGLPIAVAFGKLDRVIGFDISESRVAELKQAIDHTQEIPAQELKKADIFFTNEVHDLKKANFHIVTVPTPVTAAKQPDLGFVIKATEMVGAVLKSGDIVVYESTVYPGVTEEICLPLLEQRSGLKAGRDFKVGYSPERINPGDRQRTLDKVVKVVSGQDAEALSVIGDMYSRIVTAGVYPVSSIKVAEAAKVIENTQRDLNIALMNELALIFQTMGIDTHEVLDAAATKWNFIKFQPGLVGGHCIGVDPYYLTHKAELLGYHPQVILAGRRINDGMAKHVAQQAIKCLIHAGSQVLGNTATVLGLTFKENCPDIRNSKVNDVVSELREFGLTVQVHDPLARSAEAQREYGITLTPLTALQPAQVLVLAVAHQSYRNLGPEDFKKLLRPGGVLMDVKGIFNRSAMTELGFGYWRL